MEAREGRHEPRLARPPHPRNGSAPGGVGAREELARPRLAAGFLGYEAPDGVVVALAALALVHRRLQDEGERESSVTEP